jgi:hypothetical protein
MFSETKLYANCFAFLTGKTSDRDLQEQIKSAKELLSPKPAERRKGTNKKFSKTQADPALIPVKQTTHGHGVRSPKQKVPRKLVNKKAASKTTSEGMPPRKIQMVNVASVVQNTKESSLVLFHDKSSKLYEEVPGTQLEERITKHQTFISHIFPLCPNDEQVRRKELLDNTFGVVYDGTTMAEIEISMAKPVMIRFSDATLIVFEQGLAYASALLKKHKWTGVFQAVEDDDVQKLQNITDDSNSRVVTQAIQFGERPISVRVQQEILNIKQDINAVQISNYDIDAKLPAIVTPRKKHEQTTVKSIPKRVRKVGIKHPPCYPTELLPLTQFAPKKDTGNILTGLEKPKQSLADMIKERSERGSNRLNIYIASPNPALKCAFQAVFFELCNEITGDPYWSYKAQSYQVIFDLNREVRELNDILLGIFCYPKCDPKNSRNMLKKKVKLAGSTNVIDMTQFVLGFCMDSTASQQEVERYVKAIIAEMLSDQCKNLYYQQKLGRTSSKFSDDCKPDGPMFKALAASMGVIHVTNIASLDEFITLDAARNIVIEKMLINESGEIDKWTSSYAKEFATRQYANATTNTIV